MKPWYQELFENYADSYERESFTQGTSGEVDFIEGEIGKDKSVRILDIACGTGRHSVELARRGYRVTGVDLSEDQLAGARKNAARAGVEIPFLRLDATALEFRDEFGLALMLCEGAFPLMETDEKNFAILRGASAALKRRGKLILTTLNALYPLYHSVKDFINADGGSTESVENHFDLMTFRDRSVIRVPDDSGRSRTLHCDERYHTPPEMAWLLKSAGFASVDIYGSRLGAFSRGDALTTDDFEMLVVAQKE
jgi:SAM-dependent methyltransferase